jgi:hypothetical protein
MLITKIDVFGGEELLVSGSKNRIAVSEKSGIQKCFETDKEKVLKDLINRLGEFK